MNSSGGLRARVRSPRARLYLGRRTCSSNLSLPLPLCEQVMKTEATDENRVVSLLRRVLVQKLVDRPLNWFERTHHDSERKRSSIDNAGFFSPPRMTLISRRDERTGRKLKSRFDIQQPVSNKGIFLARASSSSSVCSTHLCCSSRQKYFPLIDCLAGGNIFRVMHISRVPPRWRESIFQDIGAHAA